jgi:hypothetical protein
MLSAVGAFAAQAYPDLPNCQPRYLFHSGYGQVLWHVA